MDDAYSPTGSRKQAQTDAATDDAYDPQAVKLKLAPEALAMLTDGIDLRGAKPIGGLRALSLSKRLRPWYERE